eukprot:scaffold320142_cov15-Prasinocladus_malaysianus.AAC.1
MEARLKESKRKLSTLPTSLPKTLAPSQERQNANLLLYGTLIAGEDSSILPTHRVRTCQRALK